MYQLEDLAAWRKARELRKHVSEVCKSFPKDEKYRLVDQLIRASRSVSANIAEGHGRLHYQENIPYSRQASGSLVECLDHFHVALDEGYIDHTQFAQFKNKYDELLKIVNGYIAYLQKEKRNK